MTYPGIVSETFCLPKRVFNTEDLKDLSFLLNLYDFPRNLSPLFKKVLVPCRM